MRSVRSITRRGTRLAGRRPSVRQIDAFVSTRPLSAIRKCRSAGTGLFTRRTDGSPVNIVVVSHLFPRPHHPSKGVFVRRQTEALAARGHDVTVVSPVPYVPSIAARVFGRRPSSDIPETDAVGDVRVHYPRFFSLPRPETLPIVSYSVRRTLRQYESRFGEADLINAHVAVPDAFAVAPIAEELDVPLVTTIHGADLQESIDRPLVERQIRRAVDGSSKILLNSHKTRRLFREHFGTDHATTVVYNGASVELARNAESLERASESFVVISVGNLTETKGHRYVLDAIAALSFDVEYVIVGDGPRKDDLEDRAERLGIERAVTFTGQIPHERVFSHLKAADVFVLPSYLEAFGVAYIEAMACGLPVVACESEGIADYITEGETGFLVPPNDTEAIRSVLAELWRDAELRNHVSRRGQRLASSTFTWERNARIVEEQFRAVLGDHFGE